MACNCSCGGEYKFTGQSKPTGLAFATLTITRLSNNGAGTVDIKQITGPAVFLNGSPLTGYVSVTIDGTGLLAVPAVITGAASGPIPDTSGTAIRLEVKYESGCLHFIDIFVNDPDPGVTSLSFVDV